MDKIEKLLRAAEAAEKEQEVEEALRLCEKVLDHTPDHPAALAILRRLNEPASSHSPGQQPRASDIRDPGASSPDDTEHPGRGQITIQGILGTILLVAGLGCLIVAADVGQEVTGSALSAIGVLLIINARRQKAALATAAAVFTDDVADVLYLRSFEHDRSLVTLEAWTRLVLNLQAGRIATEEEQLREAVKPLGDLVALGDPDETLPKLGAARAYATHDDWQAVIIHQIDAARLVLLRAGTTPSLLWELETARARLQPGQLVLLVDMSWFAYRRLRGLAETLGVSLPPPRRRDFLDGVRGFIRFKDNWLPEYLTFHIAFYKRTSRTAVFQHALRPVLAHFHVVMPEPAASRRPRAILAVILMAVLISLLTLL